ncbi:DUF6708 domain-containing protein, partial [Scandinavium sp. NPDC088450]|uniref:DUF6708 domain-containing protein n=1 Tax=Scandinavium sp. NPDC088450 TaxID=3364514 RepID=UPI00384B33EB
MMNYTGLYAAYKLNRPLTEKEKEGRFCQAKRRRVNNINDEASIIRMNSTYLETVCKYYSGIGVSSSLLFILSFFIFAMVAYGFGFAALETMHNNRSFPLFGGLLIFVFTAAAEFFLVRLLAKEWFRKTHYPIRFNRINQRVYVYKVSGEILSVPWKDIFFTPAKSLGRTSEWGIDGHILADDGETVLDTFSLAVSLTAGKKLLGEYWEFIRCYMEEDCVQ